ncbi:MAG TPA: hypothetical protein VG710_14530, partial [Opitutus sp.]|nr:hypothetical protein [Opitutus sp.]
RVHLSRDWATGNHYRFVFERGIVVWRANHASGLSVQLAGAPSAVHGALFTRESEPPLRAAPQPLETNGQCFTLQLRNVVAAVAGSEPLGVPGAEGLAALRLVERCYATRALVDQPWLTPAEAGRAHEISATLSPAA